MKRVVIYCRVSTSDQSCERQEMDLTELATRAGYQVVGIYKETGSGAKNDRVERSKVIQLARERYIQGILVTELTRWGRSTQDLISTLYDLHSWDVSLIAQTGIQFDLSTAQGKLMTTLLAALAEFERDLIRERVRSGVAAARARGKQIGRKVGYRPSDRKQSRVLKLHAEGLSTRKIGRTVGLSQNTVLRILHRNQSELILQN